MRRYETSIKELVKAKNTYEMNTGKCPIFLSDWDSDFESINVPSFDFNDITVEKEHKYYFWTDEENYKINIINYFKSAFSFELSPESFTIASNGTSSLMIAITALKEKGINKVLAFTPIYFSTLNLLDELDFDVTEFNLSSIDSFKIDFTYLERIIQKNSIEVIIITNPIFGTGIELSTDIIENISLLCNKYNVFFLMDYVYGGLHWDTDNIRNYIFNYPVLKAVTLADNYIFIESISKRVFLNGLKIALVFSQPDFMRRMLRLSVFMVGSMSVHQVELAKKLYTIQNQDELSQLISQNAKKAQYNYELIKSVLYNSSCILSESMCGYFSLVSIPKLTSESDLSFAISVLNKTGVLTTPHSRYLLKNSLSYSFRINLLINKSDLIDGIIKIKNLE